MRENRGFTLTELLIAAALMLVLLAALSGLFSSTGRAYQASERTSEAQQSREASIQLLKYEIGLAGYRGTDENAGARTFTTPPFTSSSFIASPMTLSVATGTSDTVTVRYYEDRYTGVANVLEPKTVRFFVATDPGNRNLPTLYRETTTQEPVVVGVTRLKVINYLLRTGGSNTALSQDIKPLISGVTLRLTFVDGATRDIAILLNNVQQ